MQRTLEHRPMLTGPSLTNDVAQHLQTRCALGITVIVAEKPIPFLSTLRKQWVKYERQLQRDRASTVNPEKIVTITMTLSNIHNAKFSASQHWGDAHIYVVSPDFAPFIEPAKTVYICTRLPAEQRLVISQSLDEDALVINYFALPAAQ